MVFLQEHWLPDKQVSQLTDCNQEFICESVSGFCNDRVLQGRPYGGCAIMWRKSINACFRPINCGSRRLVCVVMEYNNFKVLLINAYMPYENLRDDTSTEEFMLQLSMLEHVIVSENFTSIVVGGDFNVDVYREALHTRLLLDFFGKS